MNSKDTNSQERQQGKTPGTVTLALAAALTAAMVATQFVAPATPANETEPRAAVAVETQAATVAVVAGATDTVMTTADYVAPTQDTVDAALAKMSHTVAEQAKAGGADMVKIIVRFDDAPSFDGAALEQLGGEVVQRFDRLGLAAVRVPAGALIDFAVDQRVQRLSLDAPINATRSAYKDTVGAPISGTFNSQLTGSSIGVAVVDSGIASHSDLSSWIRQYDFVGGKYPRPEVEWEDDDDDDDEEEEWEIESYRSQPRVDGYGHGTLVASLIAGSGKNSSGNKHRGLAPSARLLSLRVLDDDGNGDTSDAIAAMNWLVEYGKVFNIKVANLSVGKAVEESVDTDPLVAAVNAAWDAGITVVVAAGNHGRDGNMTVTSPGNSPKVITVGSLTDNGTSDPSDDFVSTYSSAGPTLIDHIMKPDLLAPGNRLVGAIGDNALLRTDLGERLVDCDASYCNDDYLEMSGTSMATPVVAATAALMIQKNPDVMTPDVVKARLMTTARKIEGEPAETGAGVIDIDAALEAVVAPTLAAKSPKVKRKGTPEAPVFEVQDTSVLWGGNNFNFDKLYLDNGTSSKDTDAASDNATAETVATESATTESTTTESTTTESTTTEPTATEPTATESTTTETTTTETSTTVDGNGFLWGDEGTQGYGFLWSGEGTNPFGFLWGDEGTQGHGFLWSDEGFSSKGYLWSDSSLWGYISMWANGYLWSDNVSGVNPLIDLTNTASPINDD